MGPGQEGIVQVFKKAVAGEALPQRVRSPAKMDEEFPTIKHAAIHGAVEISKGLRKKLPVLYTNCAEEDWILRLKKSSKKLN